MKVGIYTRYQRLDSTYAMLDLADNLSNVHVADISILTPTPNVPKLDSEWDDRILRERDYRLETWMMGCDLVIFEHFPLDADHLLEILNKNQIVSALIYQWDQDQHYHRSMLQQFTCVFAPCRASVRVLREQYDLINQYELYWTPTKPRQRHVHRPIGPVRAFLPVGGSQGDQVDLETFHQLDQLPFDQMTLTISFEELYNTALCVLEKLQRKVGKDKLKLVAHKSRKEANLCLSGHDVTLLVPSYEVFALQAIDSLRLSTPVVTFNTPPLNELITPEDGILVDSPLDTPSVRVPRIVPDMAAFGQALSEAISSGRIGKLQDSCGKSLGDREKAFHQRIRNVLKDAR